MKSNPFAWAALLRRLNLYTLRRMVFVLGLVVPVSAQIDRPSVIKASSAAENIGPKIEFAATIFNFGKVKQGEVVRHDFVFRNMGTSTLEISDVNPGCGCTTAGNWDRRVEPGKSGVIPLQFNSAGFNGVVSKPATVTCNDPRQPTLHLQMQGDVWTPFTITPAMVIFNVSSETETSETKVVRIVSRLEDPVNLTAVEGLTPLFRAEIAKVVPGKEFDLKITAVPPFAATSSANLSIKTSSSATPSVPLYAQVTVQQPIAATPERIVISAGPLPAASNTLVAVRNNGESNLKLSDAKLNVPGATVDLHEAQPGKLFHVSVSFPAGFELKPGQNVEVAVKTNHPKLAVIHIPVVAIPQQVVRPAPALR